jgi:class 3 adenylate cyclase/tetratricopeptide (TPR) repeat protein
VRGVAGFLDVVGRAEAYLESEPRVSLRALAREFDLDDAAVQELVEELVDVRRVAVRDGSVLVSTRATSPPRASALPGAADTESRELTVLFCDLVGSTELSTQLDSEDYADAMRHYHEAATDVMTRFGGFVAQLLGDGLLVLFGYPEAQDDSAEQAVRAALEVVRAVDELGRGLSVRVGLHSGPCVVRNIGAGGRQDTVALGETPNTAARVQAVAEPGAVLMSAATHQLVAGWFVADDIGGHSFKGLAEPMTLHRVVAPSAVRSRLDARNVRGLAPLVGREAERAGLYERWKQAAVGAGQVVHVSGEPGIGKSRLVRALREQLGDDAHRWLEGSGSLYVRNTAFQPVIDIVEEALGFGAGDPADERLERIELGLHFVGLTEPDALTLMSSFMSVPYANAPALAELSPEARRRRTIDGLVDWLIALSAQDPVVVIVEDLHWCDPSTLELLNRIVERMTTAHLLLVTTSRPEFIPAWLEAEHAHALMLERMTDAQALEIVHVMLAGSEVADEDVAHRIVERAEGIPLFVEELSQVVLDASETAPERALWEIPATLQSPLLARLDRLGSAKPVAQVASVLGREFSDELLRLVIVTGRTDSITDAELDRALIALTAAGLFTQRAEAASAYTFKHALVQDAAYQSLLKRTRRELHARVVQILGEHFPDRANAQPELAARHAEAAGLSVEAIGFYERAAEQAEDRSAHEEALLHLQRAVDVIGTEPPGVERDRRETEIEQARVVVLFRSRGWARPESMTALERVRDLSVLTSDRRSHAAALLGLGVSHYLAARFELALDLIAESLAIAEETGSVANVVSCLTVNSNIAYFQGRFRDSLDFAERSAALYQPALHHREVVALAGDDSGVTAIGTMGWSAFQLGYLDRGIACTVDAVKLAESLGHAFTIGQARCWEAALRLDRGGDPGLEGAAKELLRYCEVQGFPAFAGAAQTILGCAAGDPSIVLDGLATAAETGTTLMGPAVLFYLADAQRQQGLNGDASASIDIAFELAAATGQHFYDAHLHRVRGECLLADRSQPLAARRRAAESAFRQAIDIARAQEARSFELRATIRLARLLRSEGREAEARSGLAELYAWFSEGFDAPDLREARALLADLSKPRVGARRYESDQWS